jgi:hypothetical protein
MPRLAFAALIMAASIATVQGCGKDTTSHGSGSLQLLLTDAPSDYIAEAHIWVSRVYLQGGSADDAPRTWLLDDPDNPRQFDLVQLRDGITDELTSVVVVPAGEYNQLRIIVDSARITLLEDMEFNGGGSTRPLTIPSGAQSGIKVALNSAVEVEEGGVHVLVVDFDIDQNFVIQGNPLTPAGITGILFTPVLREKNRQ